MSLQTNKAKIGDVSGGNYLDVESDGTIEFNGNATVWEDLRVSLERGKVAGGNVPTFAAVNGTSIYAYHFAANDEIWFSVQMPHAWKLGTTIYPHLHWMPTTDVDPSDNVRIILDYAWVNIGDDYPAPTTLTRDVPTGVNNAFNHRLHNFDDSGISGAGKTLSSVILCRFARGTAAADNYAGDIVGMEIDFHYEIDTVGSRQITTK